MRQATNAPYVKRFHKVDGVTEVGNPITKENPYMNDGSNRSNRKTKVQRHRSNKKGVSLTVSTQVVPDEKGGGATIMITKFKRTWQYIKANTNTKMVKNGKLNKAKKVEVSHKARTIGHYQLVD